MGGRCVMDEQRWDDERADQLLDAARVVLEAAGGWRTSEDDYGDDPANLLRFAELYFSEGVRHKIWPHVDVMNRGIRAVHLEWAEVSLQEYDASSCNPFESCPFLVDQRADERT